jgi:pimeloyl-ACP methyl ester carboxylesterase
MFRIVIFLILLILLITGTITVITFKRENRNAYEKLSSSEIFPSEYGDIEYLLQKGTQDGRVFLVIHGGGGGFDQGKLLADACLDEKDTWIIPSRFGYLRSELPENASPSLQAACYADLLKSLKITGCHVVALSAGGPSAVCFAADFPELVESLIMISTVSETFPRYDTKADGFKFIYKNDFIFWVISKLFKGTLLKMFGITKTDTAEENDYIERNIQTMLPAKPRQTGIEYDSHQGVSEKPFPLTAVKVPTLIFHAKDDTLIDYSNAEYTKDLIPNSKLITFEKGGHGIFISEREHIKNAIYLFLSQQTKNR